MRWLKTFSRTPTQRYIGLELGDCCLYLVELSQPKSDAAKIENVAYAFLPPGCIEDGKIVNAGEVADLINRLLVSPTNLSSSVLITCVPENKTFTHSSRYPANLAEDELLANVRASAAAVLPFNLEQVGLDFWCWPSAEKAAAEMEVTTVAVKNEYLSDKQKLARILKVNLAVVDVDCYAAWRSVYRYLTYQQCYQNAEHYVLVHIKQTETVVKIISAAREIFSRQIELGLGKVGLEQLSPYFSSAQQLQLNVVADFAAAYGAVVGELVAEIAEILTIAKNTYGHQGFRQAILIAATPLSLALAADLTQRCQVEFKPLNPFLGMEAKVAPEINYSAWATCVALAVRGVSDVFHNNQFITLPSS